MGAKKRSPYRVMAVVLAMYVVKTAVKLSIGRALRSPMITSDGAHNAADIFEALLVIVAVFVARMPPNERYPFGRKNIESIARTLIGAGLFLTALHFAAVSLAGLLSYLPSFDARVRTILPLPAHEPLRMDPALLPWVLGVTIGSIALSFAVGRYEVQTGKASGHASMEADGQETLGDGKIEAVILLGVVLEHVFHAAWLEYPFGLGVAFIVGRTGVDLFMDGWHALLQHSIGKEHEDEIRRACRATYGVREVEEVKTFRVGSQIVCNIKICTAFDASHRDLKHALKVRVSACLKELSEDLGLYFRFSRPDAAIRRVAYAAVSDGKAIAVAPSLEAASGFLVCDLDGEEVVRWSLEPLPSDCHGDLVAWLEGKRVDTVYLFGDRPSTQERGIVFAGVPSYSLGTLGLAEPIDD